MSISRFPKNYNQEGIISPREHFFSERAEYMDFEAPKSVIICFEDYVMEHFKKQPNTEYMDFWTGELIYLNKNQKELALLGNFGIGGAAAAHILEIIIAAGTKNFIVIGHAGSLQPLISIGTIVLSDKALRDEGVSNHYLKPELFAYPSQILTNTLKETLEKEDVRYAIGSSWTLASMYRETMDEVAYYQKEGIVTIEMELATLFAVAEFRGVSMASLMVISDSVASEFWDEHFHSGSTRNAMFTSIDIAAKALVR